MADREYKVTHPIDFGGDTGLVGRGARLTLSDEDAAEYPHALELVEGQEDIEGIPGGEPVVIGPTSSTIGATTGTPEMALRQPAEASRNPGVLSPAQEAEQAAIAAATSAEAPPVQEVNATDGAKRVAQENNVNLALVTGTLNEEGRISQEDVEAFIEAQRRAADQASSDGTTAVGGGAGGTA